jgi:hypothetical protein
MAPEERSSPADDLLLISLMRDSSMHARRPVIFAGAFFSHVVDERAVRRLLDTTWVIARSMCRENLDLTIAELLARAQAPKQPRPLRTGAPAPASAAPSGTEV